MDTELKQYLDRVPSGFRAGKENEIIAACLPAAKYKNRRRIFRNWLQGKTAVPVLAQEKINKLTNKKIFEV